MWRVCYYILTVSINTDLNKKLRKNLNTAHGGEVIKKWLDMVRCSGLDRNDVGFSDKYVVTTKQDRSGGGVIRSVRRETKLKHEIDMLTNEVVRPQQEKIDYLNAMEVV